MSWLSWMNCKTCWVAIAVVLVGVVLPSRPARSAEPPDPFARWEKAIAEMEAKDKKSPPPQASALFVGSSSIRLWDLAKSFPGKETINRGFGGSEIVDSTHFADRIIIPHRPRIVFLYAGDNDIAKGKPATTVHEDFGKFVERVHRDLPETRIVFIAIKPSIRRWELVEEMRKANRLIRQQTEENDLLDFIDIDKPMLGADGKPRKELFVADGLHMSEAGYAIWNREVARFLGD